MKDARIEEIVARCQQIEGIHWDNDTVARAEMVAREALSSPAPVGEVVADEMHRWSDDAKSLRWLAGDDSGRFTFGEVEIFLRVAAHLAASPSPAPTQASPPDEYGELVKEARALTFGFVVGEAAEDVGPQAVAIKQLCDAIQSLTGRVRELEQRDIQATEDLQSFLNLSNYHMDRAKAAESLVDGELVKAVSKLATSGIKSLTAKLEAAEAALASERVRTLEEAAMAAEAMPRKLDRFDGGRHADEAPHMIDASPREIAAAIRALSKKEEGE